MTKTLTEQWREGTLKSGNYYTVCYKGWSGETFPCNLYYSERIGFDANVKEVLAPVPNYTEFQRLQEQIDELQNENNNLCNDIIDLNLTIKNKGKQLDEANEVIKTTNRLSGNIDLSQLVYEDRRKIDGITMQTENYLKKWGVK